MTSLRTVQGRPRRDARPSSWNYQQVRDFVLRMSAVEKLGRSFLMAWLTILRSRLRREFGDTQVVVLGKVKLTLDLREMHDVRTFWSIHRHGHYEPESSRLLGDLLRPGDTFVDIGSNNGYYAVLASQYVGTTGRVLAIEPNPRAVERLQRNVELNGLEGIVSVLPVALGETEGTGTLSVSTFEDGWATLGQFPGPKTTYRVRVASLNDILEPTESIVMKIDAEGAEESILRGMTEVIDRTANVAILLEWNHLFGTEALWEYLHATFRVFDIVSQGDGGVALEEIRSFEALRHVFVKNVLITTGPRWLARGRLGRPRT